MRASRSLVVIGNGMVGHRFLELLVERGVHWDWEITTFCEEPRVAYDRVNLSGFFSGKTAEDLSLVKTGYYAQHGITVHIGDKASAIDRTAKTVTSAQGRSLRYDALVLATGSYPFVPPIAGNDSRGCFVYRTIDDLEAMRAWAGRCTSGAVIGGGLLGLEAGNAIKQMGLKTHVVEFAPRLMGVQVDEGGGAILRRKIEALGVSVHTGKSTSAVVAHPPEDGEAKGRVHKLTFADKSELAVDMVVFSAGIRPRDELGKQAGLTMGERGGITVDDHCRTSDPDIYAIGEVALHRGRIYGLVAPGYHMAAVAVDAISGSGATTFTGFDMSTKLKLLGVEVGSFGDAHGSTPGCHSVGFADSRSEVYKKLVLSADRTRLIGGVLVGDTASYGTLHQLMLNGVAMPPTPEDLILPARDGAKPAGMGPEHLPDAATICSCHNVSKGAICAAIGEGKLSEVGQIKSCTKAGTGCGSCVTLLKDILRHELKQAGVEVKNHVCEHFAHSRQELFHLVRVHGIRTFADLLARHGSGLGCEICKPAVGSILAACWNDHVLDKAHAPLQDTNDRFLANLQRDGTYSVVPRVPGGEITPDRLLTIGRVAKKWNLYTKITGGQRIDLFGAKLEELPPIWSELIAAGFESGHAYGKALRTVKSCVGSTWCRYGVQDSVQLAIDIENRYKGLRSPHKLKSAVSGCARECAEAQGKDFGIIATEKGWNLYVCGNGGMKPQHAQLLASDLGTRELVALIDRFLMFYVRTADRLERTATWFNKLEGGMAYLKHVLIDDSLGIAGELESDMQRIVDAY
ncbi:MAG: nitrite reductase large subunit, partial [Planctomycetes bacterium]|nr:nitrite reductase large subunit [Planctomycetota bacterium]